jgi:glycosyltransferase involved in cell wall biosynthesis
METGTNSTVSIVIPIKDRARLFEATAQSLLRQTYAHWEAMVVDDGSSPDEFERITAITRVDRRFRLMARPGRQRGACASRNAGVGVCTGKYVIFLDSDDTLAATCLERRVAVMENSPNIDFAVFLMWNFFAEPGESDVLWNIFTPEDDLDRFLRADSPWSITGPIWKRSSLSKVGRWDESARSWQDWEFHIRALSLGMNYLKVPEPDSFWRAPTTAGSIGSQSTSSRHAFSRVRLIRKIVADLGSNGALTPRRRRTLGMQFFNHAFRSRQSFRRMLLIWRTGRRAKAVSFLEFWAVLFCELVVRTARRMSRRCECLLYPDLLKAPQYGLHRLPPSQ